MSIVKEFKRGDGRPAALVFDDSGKPEFWINFFLAYRQSKKCRPKSLIGYSYDLAILNEYFVQKKIDFAERMSTAAFLDARELTSLTNFLYLKSSSIQGKLQKQKVIKFRKKEMVCQSAANRRIKISKEYLKFCAKIIPDYSGRFAGQRFELEIKKNAFLRDLNEEMKAKGNIHRDMEEPLEKEIEFAYRYLAQFTKESERNIFLGIRSIIILNILETTGMRSSELSSLKIADVKREKDGRLYVKVPGPLEIDYSEDPRLCPGTSKTKGRSVKISEDVAKIIHKYKELRAARPKAKKHEFFIVTESGSPLSQSSINSLFVKISKGIGVKINPHNLRHTWSITFLMSEFKHADMLGPKDRERYIQIAVELLRVQMGWGHGSKEPQRYAKYAFMKLGDSRRKNDSEKLNAKLIGELV